MSWSGRRSTSRAYDDGYSKHGEGDYSSYGGGNPGYSGDYDHASDPFPYSGGGAPNEFGTVWDPSDDPLFSYEAAQAWGLASPIEHRSPSRSRHASTRERSSGRSTERASHATGRRSLEPSSRHDRSTPASNRRSPYKNDKSPFEFESPLGSSNDPLSNLDATQTWGLASPIEYRSPSRSRHASTRERSSGRSTERFSSRATPIPSVEDASPWHERTPSRFSESRRRSASASTNTTNNRRRRSPSIIPITSASPERRNPSAQNSNRSRRERSAISVFPSLSLSPELEIIGTRPRKASPPRGKGTGGISEWIYDDDDIEERERPGLRYRPSPEREDETWIERRRRHVRTSGLRRRARDRREMADYRQEHGTGLGL
ncbi:hypothetical protein MMC09_001567 [Bachmanniomyces sp. S44760]|nr:hypothetical protein [Bachmanniomyces sp. S44760]